MVASFVSLRMCGALLSPLSMRAIVSSQVHPFAFVQRFAVSIQSEPFIFNGTVTILQQGEHHVVVSKPPSVVCHHSDWSGSRSSKNSPEIPMLQRAREAIGERVNLVHRLDRGASGCLLLTKASSDREELGIAATATLQQAMAEESSKKTYVALVRGEGIVNETDFRRQGWFTVDRPIKDESGKLNNATTEFRFLAGQDNDRGAIDRPRASIVLARPNTGRWHQIRRHLNGLSHPILGDTTHGDKLINRIWRNERGMLPQRTCLHLIKLEIPANPACPQGISVMSPLAPDMMAMLENHLPRVLENARDGLAEEGIDLHDDPFEASEISIHFAINA